MSFVGPMATYVFRNVIENIGLQWHVHVHRTRHPAEFPLSHIEHSLHSSYGFSSNLLTASEKKHISHASPKTCGVTREQRERRTPWLISRCAVPERHSKPQRLRPPRPV